MNISLSPLQIILVAFKVYYEGLKGEEHYSYPKNMKDSDYWSNTWFEFRQLEGFETFLPYLFHVGLVTQELWNTYKEVGNLAFLTIDRMAEKTYGYQSMDWLDTCINQPHWKCTKYEFLEKEGATLEEFIASIEGTFEGEYLEETKTVEYWQDYLNMWEDDIRMLFSTIGIEPDVLKESESSPMCITTQHTEVVIKENSKTLVCFQSYNTNIPGVLGLSDKPWNKK